MVKPFARNFQGYDLIPLVFVSHADVLQKEAKNVSANEVTAFIIGFHFVVVTNNVIK